jgi:histone H2B
VKEMRADLGISKMAIAQFNCILADLLDRIMVEARNLMIANKRNTISSKEIETSVKLLFTGEINKLAIAFARSSLKKYSENAAN